MAQKDLEARIKALEQQNRTLQDIEEIKRLKHCYGYFLQRWQGQDVADLFSDAPDVSVEVGAGGQIVGKEEVTKFFLGAGGKPAEFLHVMMPLVDMVTVEPDGKTAKGRWYGLGLQAWPMSGGKAQAIISNGIWEDEFVKENGKWKIKKLHWNRIFFCPYEDGWAKTPTYDVVHGPPRPDMPKQGPKTSVYAPYPTTYIFPYHFKHPVTGKPITGK